jgi:protein-disulfide isomerase
MPSNSNNRNPVPITRRPFAGRRAAIWNQFPNRQPQLPQASGPAPFWPLLVACIIVLAVLQGANLAYQSGLLGGAPSAMKDAMFRAFTPTQALSRQTLHRLVPVRGDVTPNPTNFQFGDAASPITLTIFTDPACTSCRATLQGWLDTVEKGDLRLVYKYWPQNPENPSAGILLELARREGHGEAFWRLLAAEREPPSSTRLLTLLERAGIPLDKQKNMLATQSENILRALEPDAAQARALDLGPPPHIAVNGYLLDGTTLIPYRLATYVERLTRNQSLVQSADYWLNP